MQILLFWKPLAIFLATLSVVVYGVPTAPVALDYYTYSDHVLSGQIYIQNIDYTKVVTVIYSDASGDWDNNGNTIAAVWKEQISGTNYEYWTFSGNIGSNGISQFYIKYDVAGTTYYDNNGNANYNVVASTPTTTASQPTTTATTSTTSGAIPTQTGNPQVPEGNSTVSSWVTAQEAISWPTMLHNINPSGTRAGFIAASLSTSNPDYFYSWIRDSALTARVLVHFYNTTLAGDSSLLSTIQSYVSFELNSMTVSTPCNCLGEPKFNTDGTSYTGPWGRPQNDGPALRSIAFISFADSFLSQGGNTSYVTDTLKPAIYTNLNYVVDTWQSNCFDLWEEVNGQHFFTLAVMRRALLDGANFATRQGDTSEASSYTATASNIATRMADFWSAGDNYIKVTLNQSGGVNKPSGLDSSVLLAANLLAGYTDGFYTPGSDQILATAVAISNSFGSLYGINANKPSWIANAIGRYPEDVYDGVGTSQGNPWFIGTLAYPELYYRAIAEWQRSGGVAVNDVNLAFFKSFDSSITSGSTFTAGTTEFNTLAQKIALAADSFFSTVHLYAATNGSMSEQYNRDTGAMQGARDLTWSHAAYLNAAHAKAGVAAF